MSTLCRAGKGWQKYERAEKSEISSFCPTHFSAFQKWVNGGRNISDFRKYFGNISEKQPFSEKISGLFFAVERPSRSLGGASRAALPAKDVFGGTPIHRARDARAPRSSQSQIRARLCESMPVKPVKPMPRFNLALKSVCKFFTMNHLHIKPGQSPSKSVKVGQTSFLRICQLKPAQTAISGARKGASHFLGMRQGEVSLTPRFNGVVEGENW
jgi:hypothetical protein